MKWLRIDVRASQIDNKGTDDDVVNRLIDIDWNKANDNKMTAGIGKADVVKLYNEVFEKNTTK